MKKVIIISFNFQPYDNPRAIRWVSILNFIQKKNILIEFVTYKKNKTKYSKNIKFHSHENILVDKFIDKNKPKKELNPNFFFKSINDLLIKLFFFHYKFIFKHLAWPDYAFFSIYPFYKTSVNLIKEKKINHIITVSHPFSCHIVGLLLKIKFPNLIWDTDSSDPFSFLNNPKPNNLILYKYLNFLAEKLVLKKCRIFYVNNYQIKKKYLKFFRNYKKKIVVVNPLLTIHKKYNFNNSSSTKFKLVYAGSFYEGIRNPNIFIDIVDHLVKKIQLKKISIRIYIFTNSLIFSKELAKYDHLKSVFILKKSIEYPKLIKFIKNDMILLNLGNKNNMQLPSKLYELIGMGGKIVNFHYDVDKESVKILNNYPNYISINLDKNININNLWNFIKQPKKINFPQHYYKKKFKKNLVEYISNLYFGKI
jgi:hypothetical protein